MVRKDLKCLLTFEVLKSLEITVKADLKPKNVQGNFTYNNHLLFDTVAWNQKYQRALTRHINQFKMIFKRVERCHNNIYAILIQSFTY